MKCGLCGFEYSECDSCKSCPLNCGKIACPNCGFEKFPKPKSLSIAEKIASKIKSLF
ncbi:MAG: hypothetical protein ACRC1M_07070 [Methanobacteriaceae archaeon]